MQVRPVEVTQHHVRVAQAEPPDDFLLHRRRRGRGQRHPERCTDRLGLGPEPHVVRPEVVPPLADQVGLVHGEQARLGTAQRLAGLRVGQLLRGEEHERAGVTRGEQRRRAGASRLLGVQHDGRQASRPQVGELIILQGDQRRHDDRRPGPQQSGQLVDRRLPAAGRQHRQHVAAASQRLGRAQLPGAEPVKAKPVPRQPLEHSTGSVVGPVHHPKHPVTVRAARYRVSRGMRPRRLSSSPVRAVPPPAGRQRRRAGRRVARAPRADRARRRAVTRDSAARARCGWTAGGCWRA